MFGINKTSQNMSVHLFFQYLGNIVYYVRQVIFKTFLANSYLIFAVYAFIFPSIVMMYMSIKAINRQIVIYISKNIFLFF